MKKLASIIFTEDAVILTLKDRKQLVFTNPTEAGTVFALYQNGTNENSFINKRALPEELNEVTVVNKSNFKSIKSIELPAVQSFLRGLSIINKSNVPN